MACDSQTLEALIHAEGLAALSQRDLLMCIADQLGIAAGFSNASTSLAQSKAEGLPQLSEHDLWMCFETSICT